MTLRVSRCCCCFDLKYGYYTYAILSLISRLTAAIVFWSSQSIVYAKLAAPEQPQVEYMSLLVSLNSCTGWFVATTAIFIVGLKGIAQERAVLIYPMIVVLILELICSSVSILILTIVVSPLCLLMVFCMAINAYDLTCLISLFLLVKENQNRQKDMYSSNICLTA